MKALRIFFSFFLFTIGSVNSNPLPTHISKILFTTAKLIQDFRVNMMFKPNDAKIFSELWGWIENEKGKSSENEYIPLNILISSQDEIDDSEHIHLHLLAEDGEEVIYIFDMHQEQAIARIQSDEKVFVLENLGKYQRCENCGPDSDRIYISKQDAEKLRIHLKTTSSTVNTH